MLKSKLNLLALLVSASLLAACGDSTTKIVEKDPIPVEDDHDHEAGAGRLVISDKDSTMLRVYNLEGKRHNNHTLRYGCCSDQYGSSLANASGVFAVGSCSNSWVR